MAAELGFEPRQTESESVVLPLHNSAIFLCFRSLSPSDLYNYIRKFNFVNRFLLFFLKKVKIIKNIKISTEKLKIYIILTIFLLN